MPIIQIEKMENEKNSLSKRQLMVGNSIKKSVADFFKIKGAMFDIDISHTVVTNVIPTKDLRMAKVYITSYAYSDENVIKDLALYLNSVSGKIRFHLSNDFSMKFSPELIFYPDDAFIYTRKAENLNVSKKDIKDSDLS